MANDRPTPTPAGFESGGRGFVSTERAQMGSSGGHDNSRRLCVRRDVDALACFDAEHPVGCRKCQRAPPEGKEHEYKLVGVEGMTGEKMLRKLFSKREEWTVDAERLKTVRLAKEAKYDELADLLAEKKVPQLRKHHFMQFSRILGLRSDIWQSRTQFKETHREEAISRSERVSYAALILAGPDPVPVSGPHSGLAQRTQLVAQTTPEEEEPRNGEINNSGDSSLTRVGLTRRDVVEPFSEGETHVHLVNRQRPGWEGSSPKEIFGFDEGELRRQRCDPLARPFASNAVTVIAKAESMANFVLRSCPDAPEYVRLESLLDSHNKSERRSSVRASFGETQRVMARMQAVRIELAQVRLRFRSGGDMAVVAHLTGTTDGKGDLALTKQLYIYYFLFSLLFFSFRSLSVALCSVTRIVKL